MLPPASSASKNSAATSPAPPTSPLVALDPTLQYLWVADIVALKTFERKAPDVFKRSYNLQFFVVVCKPQRLGGRLIVDLPLALRKTPTADRDIKAAVEVPLDWADRVQKGRLAAELKLALLPRACAEEPPALASLLSTVSVTGFTFNKPKGKAQE